MAILLIILRELYYFQRDKYFVVCIRRLLLSMFCEVRNEAN